MKSLRDLPDFEALEDAGLLSKDRLLEADIPVATGDDPDHDPYGDDLDASSRREAGRFHQALAGSRPDANGGRPWFAC